MNGSVPLIWWLSLGALEFGSAVHKFLVASHLTPCAVNREKGHVPFPSQ